MKSVRSSLLLETVASLKPFQESLLKQFENSHAETRKKRFMEDPERAGTFTDGDGEDKPSQTKMAFLQPILRYDPSEIEAQAVSLQKWEGTVFEVKKDVFKARLHDLTTENPEEEAEFSIDEISDDDRELLKPGAVFYWSIGYLTTGTGQRIRTSIIKFRRLPAWTEREIRTAKAQATEIRRILGWGNDETAACAG